MSLPLKIPAEVIPFLRCPKCGGPLQHLDETLLCASPTCQAGYPIVNGLPILIDEGASLFTIDTYLQGKATFFREKSTVKKIFNRFAPALHHNIPAADNLQAFVRALPTRTSPPKVLVIGGGQLGAGMEALLQADLSLVESDIALAPRTQIILDAHSIPFADHTFAGVIAQFVLEHAIDPYRCVAEIQRVLQDDGLLYVELPFIQQVHGRQYDFTRWTYVGLRRLLHHFAEISSGVCFGPGSALAWSLQYFFLSFFQNQTLRTCVGGLSRLLFFWLKYVDYISLKNPAALDAASALFFLGRKTLRPLSDKEIVASYRGGFLTG